MWEVLGSGADTRLVETGDGVPYEEAKKIAVEKLQEFIQPALARLEEITNDIDMERNKNPCFNAWQSNHELVIARTKKRAAELVNMGPSTFSRWYSPCHGTWWYEFAQQESIWRQKSEWTEGRFTPLQWQRIYPLEENP